MAFSPCGNSRFFFRMLNRHLLYFWLLCLALHGWRILGNVPYWRLVARCIVQAFDLSIIGKVIA
jgi:hypothetical protein